MSTPTLFDQPEDEKRTENGYPPISIGVPHDDAEIARIMKDNPDILERCKPTTFNVIMPRSNRSAFGWGNLARKVVAPLPCLTATELRDEG
jgi:hypothetical protein